MDYSHSLHQGIFPTQGRLSSLPATAGHWGSAEPCAASSPLFWNALPAPHCPGLSFPHEAPSPVAISPAPGFSHFLFRFGSFVLESHSRETQPWRVQQRCALNTCLTARERRGLSRTHPRGCALNAHPAGASGPRCEGAACTAQRRCEPRCHGDGSPQPFR